MRRVALLAPPGAVPFDIGTALHVFGHCPGGRYAVEVCAAAPGPVAAQAGLVLVATKGLRGLAKADLVIVPGIEDTEAALPAPLLAALRKAHARGAEIASICTGAFVLGAAGLLDGRRCTTHWARADELQRRYPEAAVDARALYVEDGRVATSAGITAGIDLCLDLLRRHHGERIANQVARVMVFSAHREGGQAQFVERPVPKLRGKGLAGVLEAALAKAGGTASVSDLARRANMPVRTLTRRFHAEMGMPPLQWLIAQRVRRAQTLLEAKGGEVKEIAHATGFGSALAFRRHFKRLVGVTPAAYRAAFRG